MPNQEKDDKVMRNWSTNRMVRPDEPNRKSTTDWSTNKRVKPLGENIFGTKKVDAEGAKKIRPGDESSTSAKSVEATETVNEEKSRKKQEWRETMDSFLSEARKKALDKGFLTYNEKAMMDYLSRRKGGQNT